MSYWDATLMFAHAAPSSFIRHLANREISMSPWVWGGALINGTQALKNKRAIGFFTVAVCESLGCYWCELDTSHNKEKLKLRRKALHLSAFHTAARHLPRRVTRRGSLPQNYFSIYFSLALCLGYYRLLMFETAVFNAVMEKVEGESCSYYVHAVHDADPQSHKGFGEIDDLLSFSRDGQAGHGQISFLKHAKQSGVSVLGRIRLLQVTLKWSTLKKILFIL